MKNNYAKLTLVGAGPGDPELITIKGVRALKSADVVLYDALVDPELLRYAPQAIHIPVGKRAGQASVSQTTINKLIVEHARTHGHVVRLKGGDPFVFARGFEELNYAQRLGLETDVVIGISSVMLPGYYGIPLTCRGINQSFTVLTATTSEGILSNEVIHAARNAPTALIFMGLGKLHLIADAYQKAGRGQLPVAILSNGSLAGGTVIKGTVDNILEKASLEKPATPALLIFGEGASEAFSNTVHNDSLIEIQETA
ncbi:MAG: uroporphyrinogen-III C-methyltransferase [Cyclobacteriaceae bacterium]